MSSPIPCIVCWAAPLLLGWDLPDCPSIISPSSWKPISLGRFSSLCGFALSDVESFSQPMKTLARNGGGWAFTTIKRGWYLSRHWCHNNSIPGFTFSVLITLASVNDLVRTDIKDIHVKGAGYGVREPGFEFQRWLVWILLQMTSLDTPSPAPCGQENLPGMPPSWLPSHLWLPLSEIRKVPVFAVKKKRRERETETERKECGWQVLAHLCQ